MQEPSNYFKWFSFLGSFFIYLYLRFSLKEMKKGEKEEEEKMKGSKLPMLHVGVCVRGRHCRQQCVGLCESGVDIDVT